MRSIVRIQYTPLACGCTLKGLYSEDILIDGHPTMIVIHGTELEIQAIYIDRTKKENKVDVKMLYQHKAKSLRAAKVAARRWLMKNKASLKIEVRKKL